MPDFIDDLDKGVAALSEADKANLEAVEAEKKRLGLDLDESTPPAEEDKDKPVQTESKPETAKPSETEPKPVVEDKAKEPSEKEPKDTKDGKEPEAPDRPETYIPIPKYTQEKREWKESLQAKDTEITAKQSEIDRLAAELEKAQKEGKPNQSAQKIESLAERIGVEPELVKELIDVAREGYVPQSAPNQEKKEEVKPAVEPADPFPKEWDETALPELRKQYPGATAEQLADAKGVLDKAAHSDFRRYPMDYILWNKAEELKTILATPRKKTIEAGAHGKGDITPATPEKPDLGDLTPAKLKEIEKARAAEADAEDGGGVRVMRNGREMVL